MNSEDLNDERRQLTKAVGLLSTFPKAQLALHWRLLAIDSLINGQPEGGDEAAFIERCADEWMNLQYENGESPDGSPFNEDQLTTNRARLAAFMVSYRAAVRPVSDDLSVVHTKALHVLVPDTIKNDILYSLVSESAEGELDRRGHGFTEPADYISEVASDFENYANYGINFTEEEYAPVKEFLTRIEKQGRTLKVDEYFFYKNHKSVLRYTDPCIGIHDAKGQNPRSHDIDLTNNTCRHCGHPIRVERIEKSGPVPAAGNR